MKNFTYCNPTKIEFGKDKEQLIGKHIAEAGIKKVLLAYGSERIKKEGLFDLVTKCLEAEGIEYIGTWRHCEQSCTLQSI